MRHGPHHSAQKSTTTGPVAFSTSASKFASETLPTAMGYLVVSNREYRPRGEHGTYGGRRRSVKAASRGGEAGERGIQGFCGNLHQIRHIRPHQSGADRPVRDRAGRARRGRARAGGYSPGSAPRLGEVGGTARLVL